MRKPHRTRVDPSLLDVVPWSYGFAHSWALAALLSDPSIQAAILSSLPLPGPGPHQIAGEIHREKGVKPRRADLAFTLVDGDGAQHPVAVETKVNDAFDGAQVRAYRAAGFVPLLNLPASTGLLLAATDPTEAGEIRLMPEVLLAAVESTNATFGPLLYGYLRDLGAEAARAKRALARANGSASAAVGNGRTPTRVLEDVAWIAEVYRALPDAAHVAEVSSHADMRIEANDRGFFYAGAFAWLTGGGALWVDVLADVRTGARAIAIKAGKTDLAGAWDAAAAGGPPDRDGWRLTARRLGGGTCTVWKLDCDRSLIAPDAAAVAARAAKFTRSFARR